MSAPDPGVRSASATAPADSRAVSAGSGGGTWRSLERKTASIHQGKQEWQASREAGADVRAPEAHERVFSALTDAQRAHGGQGVYLDEVARASGLDQERTRVLLHNLTAGHHLVTELQRTDAPDMGPRFEAKPPQ